MADVFNLTTLIVFASFVVFMFAMKAVYFDPMLKLMDEREHKMRRDRNSAEALTKDCDALSLQYDQALKEAQIKGMSLIRQLRQDASKSAAEVTGKARQDANARIEKQLEELSQWKEEAYAKLASDRANLKEAVLAKVTRKKVPTASL